MPDRGPFWPRFWDALTHSGPSYNPTRPDPVADGAWGSVWLHGDWAWLTRNMATPERELAADAVARWSARLAVIDNDPDRGEPEGLRWWREP